MKVANRQIIIFTI